MCKIKRLGVNIRYICTYIRQCLYLGNVLIQSLYDYISLKVCFISQFYLT